jgi:hypothetical protein
VSAYLTMDEPEYWHVPPRLQRIREHLDEVIEHPDESEAVAAKTLSGMRAAQTVLGDPENDGSPVANLVEFPPFFPLPRHTHDCDVVMIVIKGSIYAEDKILRPGDRMTAVAHEFYGPEVAGPDGCTRVEFFASLSGLLEVIYQGLDGQPVLARGLENAGVVNPRELAGIDELRALLRAARADAAANTDS